MVALRDSLPEAGLATQKEARARARKVLWALSAVSFVFISTVGFGLNRFAAIISNEIATAAAVRNVSFAASLLAEDRNVTDSAEAMSPELLIGSTSNNTQILWSELRKGVIKDFQLIRPDGVITDASRTADIGKRIPADMMQELRIGRHVDTRQDVVNDVLFPVGTAAAYAPLISNEEVMGGVGVWVDRSADAVEAFRLLQLGYLAFSLLFVGFGIPTGIVLRRYLLHRFMLESELAYRTNELSFGEAVAQIGYWSLAPGASRIEFSNEARRLLGIPLTLEVSSLPGFAALFDVHDSARITSGLRDVMAGTINEFRTETGIIDSDGGHHDLRLVARARGEDGKAGLFGVMIDITAEKRFRRSLRESEAKFRLLADNASDVMVFYGQDHVFKYVSPSIERITGYKHTDLLGSDVFANVHPDDRDQLIARREPTSTQGRQALWRLKRADGVYIWMESTASVIPDQSNPGQFQIVSISRDVTDRVKQEQDLKQAQQALQDSERTFRLLADNASDIISFYDKNRVLKYVSPSATRISGFSADEVLGTDTFAIVHPDDLPQLLARRGLTGEGKPMAGAATWRMKRKDGSYIWMESTATIIDKPDHDFQVVSIARDITERVEREAQLKAIQAELEVERSRAEQANVAKSQFLATMSHELRTPMTGIIGMAELLLGSQMTAEQTKQMQMLSHSAHILLDLLNEILDLSKIESGKLEMETADFHLIEVFRETREMMAANASAKGLALHVPDTIGPVGEVSGDAKHLRQVLLNLVGNAIKFTAAGAVRVTASQQVSGDDVILSVSVIDTGIGISPQNQKRLFQAFTQAEATTARRFGGTGLGLSISKHLVTAMGGDITAVSEPGKGSTFSFTVKLKKARGPLPALGGAEAGAAAAAAKSLRVLLAEDTETSRYLITAMLERGGHSVVAVEDGEAAITKAREMPFDILLIDMHMPIIDGPEAITIIRATVKRAAKTPIIALTADLIPENRARYIQAGANVVVGKPVDWSLLAAEMARLTGQSGEAQRQPQDAPATKAEDSALDETALNDIAAAVGAEKLKMLLGTFVDNLKRYETDLDQAFAAGDLKALKRVAHAMRGLGAQFGAVGVAKLTRHIEEDMAAIGDYAAVAAQLKTALHQSIAAAERLRA
ncbi:MAG: PAS domain S-box protein [Rhodospirillaceae bacterium]|nr:PAS domain S-box protein [Rhodospirillaceae bacterium]